MGKKSGPTSFDGPKMQKPRRGGASSPGGGTWRPGLLGNDLGRTGAFRALLDLVGDALSLGQRLEAAALDGAMMDEYGCYPAGTWIRSPHNSEHCPYVEDETVIWIKTGHLLP